MIMPYHFTLWDAASSPRTQAFLLVVAMFDDLAIMFERQAGILFEQKRPG
jgi:cytochrome bd-type quinol oxidase subunit 2